MYHFKFWCRSCKFRSCLFSMNFSRQHILCHHRNFSTGWCHTWDARFRFTRFTSHSGDCGTILKPCVSWIHVESVLHLYASFGVPVFFVQGWCRISFFEVPPHDEDDTLRPFDHRWYNRCLSPSWVEIVRLLCSCLLPAVICVSVCPAVVFGGRQCVWQYINT